MITISKIAQLAKLIRKDILISTFEAKSGHPTSCLSAVELVVVLFYNHLVFETYNYPQIYHDEFVLSKGHAAPLLYSIYKRTGIINEDLLSLRKLGSLLEGHPSVRLKAVKYATGSLGQGLSIAVGAAWARKYRNLNSKVYVLVGDGEFAEGSNYEALTLASKYNLNNLCLILDVNRLGQSGQTYLAHQIEKYSKILEAFGWQYVIIDGHNIEAIDQAYKKFNQEASKPFAIIAKTIKGKGVSFLEDKDNWHGKPLSNHEELQKALNELDINQEDIDIQILYRKYPDVDNQTNIQSNDHFNLSEIDIETKPMATRQAISVALSKVGNYIKNLIVLDADVKNSTYTEYFEKLYNDRFIQCHIAEQAMVGISLGLAKNGFIPYLSTFGAFFTRAFDFIRMMVYSKPPLVIFTGTHAGISIGEDGASQMALEDIAMFTSLIESTVLYPSDSISAQKLLIEVFKQHFEGRLKGIVYFRTSRPSTSNIYNLNENFEIGKVKVVKKSHSDKVAILSAGVPLFEALKAYELLQKEGINIRVIDLYTVKPIDEKYLIKSIDGIKKIIVVEEHSIYGSIGQIISYILLKNGYQTDYFEIMAVNEIPLSAPANDLLSFHKLDSIAIRDKVKSIL